MWSPEDSRREYETAQTNRSTYTVKWWCCTRTCRIQTKVKSTELSGSRSFNCVRIPRRARGRENRTRGRVYSRVLYVNMLVGSTYVHIRLYKSTTAPSRGGGVNCTLPTLPLNTHAQPLLYGCRKHPNWMSSLSVFEDFARRVFSAYRKNIIVTIRTLIFEFIIRPFP